ncbi:class I SAM-dependent methyltransferase [Crateriforma conspicua]|uniref:Tellurite resistance protein TehB n=1 Tax=Crateriforma conspicua TaxID=2527996 RepID=A0A5C5XR47_9PLAN|nr:class I SAM-dependent methyltransferase [Crateriforma conspicua]QDV66290.1 tellurite resistance protein TehB [Crateriforma conspicua]TWT65696.1 tellurite resistance protein TehB [Crateriforma conspicua]
MPSPDWNDRFSDSEYAYGTEPNGFLVRQASRVSDPVLSIAEGEGRNAVYLAGKGHSVHAVDGSKVGLAKAVKLANQNGVQISTEVADLSDYEPAESAFGSIISIYAHLDGSIRRRLYPLLVQALKPGGILILEAYSENQIGRGTGGPANVDLLMSCSKIEQEFGILETVLLHETEREVHEGKFHTGTASVIQYVGRRGS